MKLGIKKVETGDVMIGKTVLILFLLLLLPVNLKARSYEQEGLPYCESKEGRPNRELRVHDIGRVWSAVSNFGTYGDPMTSHTGNPSYEWPGGTGAHYLFEGWLWIGAEVNGVYYVSDGFFAREEFSPSTGTHWVIKKLGGTSMYDIECEYDDWDDQYNEEYCQLGLKIIQKAMQWAVPGFDDFIAYEYKITYIADSSFHKSDTLKGVYIAWVFDADAGGGVSPRYSFDDLVGYDGWVNNEWTEAWAPPESVTNWCGGIIDYPYDRITLNPDGTVADTADGILDQMTVFGDEPDEKTIYGDTLVFWRNFSYIYDGDDLGRPDNDEKEQGMAPGYIGGIVLYAPTSPTDSVWIDAYGDTARIIRPCSHQWWYITEDPRFDSDKYLYMVGKHSLSQGYRFMVHPYIWGGEPFDYRFMHTIGPYEIANGDTLEFVFAGLMGFGLNGGYGYGKGVEEGIFEQDKWYPGLRWVADQAIKAYYMGSIHSDPLHPSGPSEDIHWLIPIPPEVPYLEYSAGEGVVTLAWNDIAERTPDPIDGIYDFVGYRVYRAEFKPGRWKFIHGFVDSVFALEHGGIDSFPYSLYEWIGKGGAFPHTYVDDDVIYGIPYFYAVTAFDAGRRSPPALTPIRSLESEKTNYKKTARGAGLPIFVKTKRLGEPITAKSLNKITVAPNPYLGSAQWERKDEDRIQFMNLPGSCRILIYTLSGDLVKKIEHTDGTGDEYWNLLSRDGMPVVSGLYIYKVEVWDNKGRPIHKIGKFVIIR